MELSSLLRIFAAGFVRMNNLQEQQLVCSHRRQKGCGGNRSPSALLICPGEAILLAGIPCSHTM